ncbi:hypothetical protein M3G91_01810 [Micromonospora chalcea]|uniref:hypothetical protein n=1 Tax=Micromonospora chalcea TaxID=1874 RepID=UPI0021A3356E|nr:hypothetical protein [Micromonospora chalcea]MCT2276345.1 hypothetical protein [Micromonospora chalcea]
MIAVVLVLSAACAGLLGWIVLLLAADPRPPVVVRARAVVTRPAAAPVGPDRPLVNPMFAAHIAAESARFAAARRAADQPVRFAVDVSQAASAVVAVTRMDGYTAALPDGWRRPYPSNGVTT